MHNPCNNPVRKQIPRRKAAVGLHRFDPCGPFNGFPFVYLLCHTGKAGNSLEACRTAKSKIQKNLACFPSLFPLGRLFFLHAPPRRGRPIRGKSPHIRKYSEIRRLVSAGGRAPKNYYNQYLYQIPLRIGGSRIVFGWVPGQPEGKLEKLDWHHRQWQFCWK